MLQTDRRKVKLVQRVIAQSSIDLPFTKWNLMTIRFFRIQEISTATARVT